MLNYWLKDNRIGFGKPHKFLPFPSRFSLISASDIAQNQPIIKSWKNYLVNHEVLFMLYGGWDGLPMVLCSALVFFPSVFFLIRQQRKRCIVPKPLISELNWSGLNVKVRKRYSWQKEKTTNKHMKRSLIFFSYIKKYNTLKL